MSDTMKITSTMTAIESFPNMPFTPPPLDCFSRLWYRCPPCLQFTRSFYHAKSTHTQGLKAQIRNAWWHWINGEVTFSWLARRDFAGRDDCVSAWERNLRERKSTEKMERLERRGEEVEGILNFYGKRSFSNYF